MSDACHDALKWVPDPFPSVDTGTDARCEWAFTVKGRFRLFFDLFRFCARYEWTLRCKLYNNSGIETRAFKPVPKSKLLYKEKLAENFKKKKNDVDENSLKHLQILNKGRRPVLKSSSGNGLKPPEI